jgi:hypothetical protein
LLSIKKHRRIKDKTRKMLFKYTKTSLKIGVI